MSQKLPVGGFKWEDDILIITKKLKKIYKTPKNL